MGVSSLSGIPCDMQTVIRRVAVMHAYVLHRDGWCPYTLAFHAQERLVDVSRCEVAFSLYSIRA